VRTLISAENGRSSASGLVRATEVAFNAEMPTVAPPGQDYDGLRPALLMYAAKDRPNNVLRVTYFVIDASQLDSHREAAFQYEVVKRPDSARF
jgi:hypothetical protein